MYTVHSVSFRIPRNSIAKFINPGNTNGSAAVHYVLKLAGPSGKSTDIFKASCSGLRGPTHQVNSILSTSGRRPNEAKHDVLLTTTSILNVTSSGVRFTLRSYKLADTRDEQQVNACSLKVERHLTLTLTVLPRPRLLVLSRPVGNLSPRKVR